LIEDGDEEEEEEELGIYMFLASDAGLQPGIW
jgi:hypothetical protein